MSWTLLGTRKEISGKPARFIKERAREEACEDWKKSISKTGWTKAEIERSSCRKLVLQNNSRALWKFYSAKPKLNGKFTRDTIKRRKLSLPQGKFTNQCQAWIFLKIFALKWTQVDRVIKIFEKIGVKNRLILWFKEKGQRPTFHAATYVFVFRISGNCSKFLPRK